MVIGEKDLHAPRRSGQSGAETLAGCARGARTQMPAGSPALGMQRWHEPGLWVRVVANPASLETLVEIPG
jgi:hypothetical protein